MWCDRNNVDIETIIPNTIKRKIDWFRRKEYKWEDKLNSEFASNEYKHIDHVLKLKKWQINDDVIHFIDDFQFAGIDNERKAIITSNLKNEPVVKYEDKERSIDEWNAFINSENNTILHGGKNKQVNLFWIFIMFVMIVVILVISVLILSSSTHILKPSNIMT